jgi:hypothetical protein
MLLLVILAIVIHFKFQRPSRPKDEGVNIEAEANDPELIGRVTIIRDVYYPGIRPPEGGAAIVRYDTTYSGGGPCIRKWILSSDGPYLKLRGHEVLYEYFREDGSLEHDRLVSPEAKLGGGVNTKERLRFFDEQNQLLHERWLREDGTLGVTSDHDERGLYQVFRSDGQRLHSQFYPPTAKGQRSIYYRRDGKTVWMETDESGHSRVYFDLHGNPVDLRFTRRRVGGGFSMGPQSQPVLTCYDVYFRADNTLEYEQAWYTRFDKATDRFADTLGAVVIYDQTGYNPTEYKLELRPASEPRFIQEVVLHSADKTSLVRRYRSPGCRLSEDVFDQYQRVIEHRDFGVSDYFKEEVKEIVFQGFIHNVRGIYDDETYDI